MDRDMLLEAARMYRKNPVVIEAVQWFKHGDHPAVVPFPVRVGLTTIHGRHEEGYINTLEGGHTVSPKDWIITGVKGELYPCKPDIFEQTYESVLAAQQPSSAMPGPLLTEYRRRARYLKDASDRSNAMECDFLEKKILNAEANEALNDFGIKRAIFTTWLLQVVDDLIDELITTQQPDSGAVMHQTLPLPPQPATVLTTTEQTPAAAPTYEQLAGALTAVREKGLRACDIALSCIGTFGKRDANGLVGLSRERYDEVSQLQDFISAAPQERKQP